MSAKKLLTYFCIIILFAACQGNKPMQVVDDEHVTAPSPLLQPVPELPTYTITEDFEQGDKKTYAEGVENLLTGSWTLKNALIGSSEADQKIGERSVRLFTGSLSMNFDLAGVKQISIKHSKYGSGSNSTWSLYFSTDSGATYQLLASVKDTANFLTTDSFAINTNAKIRFKISKKGSGRVNIDDITFKGHGDPGIIIGEAENFLADTAKIISSSAPRGVTLGKDAPPAVGDNSNLLFGNPSGAQPVLAMADNYLMDMGYYIESYNNTKAEPNWVSWHIDAGNVNNTAERRNNFAGFNGLPTGWFTVQSGSYNFTKYGFDRGHNCPSADRTSSANANAATFLMCNMIPQAPQNNQHTWNNFEAYLRSLVLQGNEVYVIMGSYGTGGTGAKGFFKVITAANHTINVPQNIWKIALVIPAGNMDISRVNTSTRVIAVNTPNDNSISKDWKKYLVTVRDIEKATGYNILSNLPQNVQDMVESRKANIQ